MYLCGYDVSRLSTHSSKTHFWKMASAGGQGSAQFPGNIAPPPPAANPNDQARQANVDAAPSASATNASQISESLCPGTFEELHKKCKGTFLSYRYS